MGKEFEKEYIYIYIYIYIIYIYIYNIYIKPNHCAIHLKLIQRCKSTIFHFFKKGFMLPKKKITQTQ